VKLSDEELVDGFRSGDEDSFRILVERHSSRIFNIIYTTIKDRSLAEDLSQEVFLRMYRFLDGFKKKCRFSTWLYRITVNVCFNAQRKRKEESKVVSLSQQVANVGSNPGTRELEDESFSPRKTLEREELVRKINSAIDSLPEVLKMTFILREFEDLSYEELAKILRCSQGTIKSRLCRAREALRQKLEVYLRESR
jgi:RNA polymerase sigma-70 factor (ECF subfamily)